VFVRNEKIILASGSSEIDFANLSALPLTRPGQPGQHTVSLLAAIGAALALGIAPQLIHAGIETFEMGQTVQPRF
jgi:cyanophycin synthetase